MTTALIVAGVVMALLGSNLMLMSGYYNSFWVQWVRCFLGLGFIAAACVCFYIAGTMAGAQ